jgi:serine kinase of HPr protein (carbohydrate metabolism regulator)
MIVHAGLIAARIGGTWRGALIEGPSGSGKSDLALRCLAHGARMVADDRVLLWRSGALVYGRSPEALSGLMEVRGVGVVGVSTLPFVAVDLVITCAEGPAQVERFPEDETTDRLNRRIPLRRLWPYEPSCPLKLMALLERVGQAG